MATLTGSTIAGSYKDLLKIAESSKQAGLDGTLRAVEDGDATASALYLATDSALISGADTKLYFYDADGGEYISADASGVLSVVAGAEIDLTATAVDLNGTLDVSGTLTVGGNIDFNSGTIDTSTQTVTVELNQAADSFTFDGASDNILSIDASNNRVGIGTASPQGKLNVVTASSGATVDGSGDELVVENSTHAGISILGGSSDSSRLYFGDSSQPNAGLIYYNHSSDYMALYTNTSEKMRIDSSGDVDVKTGDLIISDSGGSFHMSSSFYQYAGRIDSEADTIAITFVDTGTYWGSWHKIHVGGRLDAFNNSYCESVVSGADSNASVVWNENSIVEEGATISAAGTEDGETYTITWTLSDEIKIGDGTYMIFGSHPITSITLSNA